MTVFNKQCCEKQTHSKTEIRPLSSVYTKINSKWIKDLKVTETTKLMEENIGSNLFDISLQKNLFFEFITFSS